MGFGKRLKKAVKKVTKPVTSTIAPVTKPVESAFAPVARPVRDVALDVAKPVESAFSTVTDKSTYDTAGEKIGRSVETGAEQTYKEYDRYTSSTTGAYLTPYLSMYDSDGRMALREAYGGYAQAGASLYNPAAGAAVGAGLAAYDAHNATEQPGGGAGVSAFANPDAGQGTVSEGFDAWWLIPAGLAAIAGVVVVFAVMKGRK